jgi:hypothetical protein
LNLLFTRNGALRDADTEQGDNGCDEQQSTSKPHGRASLEVEYQVHIVTILPRKVKENRSDSTG